MKAIDIGVNFHSSQLEPVRDEILDRARDAGLAAILATGTSYESSLLAKSVAIAEPGFVFATAGVHPHVADHWGPDDLERFEKLWSSPQVVAIGECGLDYNRNYSTRANQRHAFIEQLRAAGRHKKPLFLHCRDAFDEFMELLTMPGHGRLTGVVHCFTGTADEARQILDMGFDIGITGWITDLKRGGSLRDLVHDVPLDRLHLETDAPYLSPKNLKRRRSYNEPANVIWVAKELATLKDLPVEEVVRQCTLNSRRMFRLTAEK